jgi:hypothetical protein
LAILFVGWWHSGRTFVWLNVNVGISIIVEADMPCLKAAVGFFIVISASSSVCNVY